MQQVCALLATLCFTPRASAQSVDSTTGNEPVFAADRIGAYDRSRTDPLLPTGITLASLGAAGVIGGVVVHQTVRGPRYCGLSGCFEVVHHPRRMQAIGLIGGSAATVVTGTAVALSALGGAPVEGARNNETMMVAGVGLTTGGIAGMVSVVTLVAGEYGRHGLSVLHLMAAFSSGAVGLGAGIPLWAVGAHTRAGPKVGQLHIDGRGITWSTTF